MTYPATVERVPTAGGTFGQMRETIRRIGSAIRNASTYPPIRNHAAALASQAPPKDFLGQLRIVYNDFIHRWRYVKDPSSKELLTNSPEAIWKLTIGGDGIGVGLGKGAGDCDCAATALGSLLSSIGFKVRLGTTAGLGTPPGRLFGHIFIQAESPQGWVTLDPVLHPKQPFGATAKHSRIAWWDLDGNSLGYKGNVSKTFKGAEMSPNIEEWQDYGFGGTDPDPNNEPEEWSTVGLADWGWMTDPSSGRRISTISSLGFINGNELNGMLAEVDLEEYNGQALARTPMLELSLDDYAYVKQNGMPYDGMLALGDTGEVYTYDGTLGRGFFKKLFKKVKGAVKKVRKRIKKGIRKVLKKSKFGRMLLKVGGKIKAIAMKVVKPLMKFVGKWAGKLAPIAALVPGYGTAIAAGLAAAGKVAKLMTKYSVKTAGKKGSVRTLALKDPRALPAFQRELNSEAARMSLFAKQNPAKYKAMLARMKARSN